MIEGVISYIRSWFPTTQINELSRKRRAPDFPQFGSPKYRRVLSPMCNNFDDDLYDPPTRLNARRKLSNANSPVIILDDEDSKPNKPYRFKDTKYSASNNGKFEDMHFGKVRKSTTEKKMDADKSKTIYISKYTHEPILSSRSPISNGTKPKLLSPIMKSPRDIIKHKPKISPSLDYSIRLEDKQRYKELLENITSRNSFSSSGTASVFATPVGRFYNSSFCGSDRALKILTKVTEKVHNKDKPIEVVDLTESSTRERKPRLSTKETVIKVLDNFENEPAVIDDSDSDVEILPESPSPKPDIKVDPVNSLKTVVDTSQVTHRGWLLDYTHKYDQYLKSKSNEIKAYTENSESLNQINKDILVRALNKKVHDCLAIKETILPIEIEEEETELPPLTDEQLRMVKKAFSGDPNEVLTKKFNLNVTRRDMQTLAGLNWLNDNVINFYMNLIIERGTDSKWPKAYCMNTFFYQKLSTSGPESLRRWTRRVDIFAHEFICVPIHLGMHWCMAIIDLTKRTIKYYDSMGKDNNECLYALKNYLEYEHKDKKNESFDTSDFVLENVQNIPQQMNGSDCGMFSCTFAEFATRRSKFSFEQQDMPYLRKKMVVEILTGQLLIQ